MKRLFLLLFVSAGTPVFLVAGAGTTAGRTLLEDPSARLTALGSASSALQDDAAVLAYNPAVLGTLSRHQANFLFHKGPFGDAYSNVVVGLRQGWGASIGYYDTGDIELNDGVDTWKAAGQSDITFSIGYGQRKDRWSWGFAGKYLSTELAERDNSMTWAGDAGAQFAATSRFTFGVAIQNLGPSLHYGALDSPLPRLARVGAAWRANVRRVPTQLLIEAPYEFEEQRLRWGGGIEALLHPLVLRAGYRTGSELQGLNLGAGFLVGNLGLDYAFGFSNDVSASHRLSASLRFGSETPAPVIAAAPATTKPTPRAIEPLTEWKMQVPVATPQQPMGAWKSTTGSRRVYEVKQGDTLRSIAKFFYGREDLWRLISDANGHLSLDLENLKPGTKLVLP